MKKHKLSNRSKKVLSILALLIFIAFSAVVFVLVGKPMIRFLEQPELFRSWVDAHGIFGRLAFIGMVVLQVMIAFIPGEVLEIGAGYAFGAFEGTLLCMAGSALGSTIVFLLVRKFGVRLVEAFFPIEKIHSLKFLQDTKRLNLIVTIIYLIPGTPKDLLGYFIPLTQMKLWTWVLITFFARIPSLVTSTISGDALGLQRYEFAAIMFAVTIAISLVGILVYRSYTKRKNKDHGLPETKDKKPEGGPQE